MSKIESDQEIVGRFEFLYVYNRVDESVQVHILTLRYVYVVFIGIYVNG